MTNGLGELVQELSYNRKNLPVTQKDSYGNQTDFAYGADGQLKEVRRGNSRRREPQRTIQQYEYNARGQIVGYLSAVAVCMQCEVAFLVILERFRIPELVNALAYFSEAVIAVLYGVAIAVYGFAHLSRIGIL